MTETKAYKYTLGRYGQESYMQTQADVRGYTLEDFCTTFYREQTGDGETRNPSDLIGDELLTFTPAIKRKKNEQLGDYNIRQLDYWIKKTAFDEEGVLRWLK